MKKLLITALVIAAAVSVYAASYEVVQINASNVTTNTNAASATIYTDTISGRLLGYAMDSSTNMVCSITLLDNYGLSLGGDRSVGTVTTNAIGTNHVLTTALYTRADRVQASFYGSFDTNGTATATLKLLLEVK